MVVLKNTVEGLEYEAEYTSPGFKERSGLWSKYAKTKVKVGTGAAKNPEIVDVDVDVFKMLYEIMVTTIKSVKVHGYDADTDKTYNNETIDLKDELDWNRVPIAITEDLNKVVMAKFFRQKA